MGGGGSGDGCACGWWWLWLWVVVVAVAVRSFSKCLRERERACGRLANNERALKLKRGKKNSGKILGLGGGM